MSKNIIIKLVILLVVIMLVYSIFWFFKIGQVEKKINNFISENGSNISAGEVIVSGFPLSQKITVKDLKFTIPSSIVGNHHIVVKHLEANAGIFSSDFVVTVEGSSVFMQDRNDAMLNVAFNKAPEVTFSIGDGGFVKASYRDIGYKILDTDQKVLYAAAASVIGFEAISDGDKVINKVNVDIREIEGFDIVDVYKNSLEKKITDGIKTGEITLGSASAAAVAPATGDIIPQVGLNVVESPIAAAEVLDNTKDTTSISTVASIAPIATAPATMDSAAIVPNTTASVTPDVLAAIVNQGPSKGNFILSLEYASVSSLDDKSAAIALDPTQMQEAPAQYTKVIKVNNLEFSNSLYKIFVNGELRSFQDDNSLSGSIAIKVEKIDNLIMALSDGFNKINEDRKAIAAKSQDLSTLVDSSLTAPIVEDPYKVFLNKIVTNLNPVAKELAAKNAVSKEDIAAFDIRREKNLEFLINETSLREILGKF